MYLTDHDLQITNAFEKLAKQLLAVPKSEIEKSRAEYKKPESREVA
jgi:hypothetical protein